MDIRERSSERGRTAHRNSERSSCGISLSAVLGLLFLCMMAPASPIPCAGQSTEGKPDYKGGTLQVLDFFLEGDYETVCAYFSEDVADMVGPKDLGKAWKKVQDVAGPFKSLGEPTLSVSGEYHIVKVPAHFHWQTWEFVARWDAEGALAGFLLGPPADVDSAPSTPEKPRESDEEAVPTESEVISETGKQHPELLGHWEGKIEIPDSPLIMWLDIEWKDQQWSGTAVSPLQPDMSHAISDFRVTGADVAFTFEGIDGDPRFKGTFEDGSLQGIFSQSGLQFPCSFGRESTRPQVPTRPFPYNEEAVSYNSGAVRLEGTLTLPSESGPFPAALLLSGSGAQDRDATLFGHKPFLVLADFLTRAGIAVLRVDDRGVGGSTGAAGAPTIEDFVEDALAGVGFLHSRTEIDPKKIGLIGHSEGGIVAPMAAMKSDQIAFIIMLAGSGVPGDEVLVRQVELLNQAAGMHPDTLQRVVDLERKIIDLVKSGASGDQVQKEVRNLAEIQMSAAGGLASLSAEERLAAIETAAARGTEKVVNPWFSFFFNHDPRPTLQMVQVPVLALIGELDLQVGPKQNLPEIRKALETGRNPDATVRELPELNHLFQTAETGRVHEYAAIEETMSPVALETIRDWILARFGSN